jgi:hypothetical protein
MKKIFILLIFLSISVFAEFGFDIGWQYRWEDGNLFNAAVILPKFGIGNVATGLHFQANKKKNYSILDVEGAIDYKTHSYYGVYAGYFLNLSPIFRPGAVVGFGWDSKEEFINKIPVGYTDYKFTPYFGLDIHCWFLSFRISNEGIGCGINVLFGN